MRDLKVDELEQVYGAGNYCSCHWGGKKWAKHGGGSDSDDGGRGGKSDSDDGGGGKKKYKGGSGSS